MLVSSGLLNHDLLTVDRGVVCWVTTNCSSLVFMDQTGLPRSHKNVEKCDVPADWNYSPVLKYRDVSTKSAVGFAEIFDQNVCHSWFEASESANCPHFCALSNTSM